MTTPEPTPDPPTGKHQAARRRRLAYLLAAAILLAAGVVAGVVATRPAPKRHHVVAVVKPKPVNHDLTLAAFLSRWNRLIAGPSDVATARIVAYASMRTGRVLARKSDAVSIAITSPSLWQWDVPHMDPLPTPINVGAFGVTSGTATTAGATVTRNYDPMTVRLYNGTPHTFPPQSPLVQHYGAGDYVAMTDALPWVRVERLRLGEPLHALANPEVVSSTRTSWQIRFANVVAGGLPAPSPGSFTPTPPRHPITLTPSQFPAGDSIAVENPAGPTTSTLTLTVTPTGTGGLQIVTPTGTLNAEPAGAP